MFAEYRSIWQYVNSSVAVVMASHACCTVATKFSVAGAALASTLVRHLSDVFIGSLILRVFDDPTLPNSMATLPAAAEAVRKSLQTVASSPFYNILLMAGLDTVRLVLQEVSSKHA